MTAEETRPAARRQSFAALRELGLQTLAAALVLGAWILLGEPVGKMTLTAGFFLVWLIGLTAFLLARLLRSPAWWQAIHLFFAPALCLALFWQERLEIAPYWSLAAFLLLWIVFRGAPRGQAPLYLSSEAAARYAAARLPENAALLDIGAGIGSFLLPLARLRPDLALSGIENAPALWALGWLRLVFSGKAGQKIHWRFGDFWRVSWTEYDAVYCFLSPLPMPAVWEKARREMRPDSLVFSKAFPIPDAAADLCAETAEKAADALYVYRVTDCHNE